MTDLSGTRASRWLLDRPHDFGILVGVPLAGTALWTATALGLDEPWPGLLLANIAALAGGDAANIAR